MINTLIEQKRKELANIIYFIYSWIKVNKIIVEDQKVIIELSFFQYLKYLLFFKYRRECNKVLKELNLKTAIRIVKVL